MHRSGSEVCLNCGVRLDGEYCHACGQRDLALDRGLWSLIVEALSEVFETDGRLLRTLPAFFFRPGFLVAQYLAGRRVHYTSPLRVYVFAAIVGFFTLHWVALGNLEASSIHLDDRGGVHVGTQPPTASDEIAELDAAMEDSPWLRPFVAKAEKLRALPPEQAAEIIVDRAFQSAPQVLLAMLPIFAALLKLLYLRRRYLDHLLLSLNLHAVGLLLLALSAAVPGLVGTWVSRLCLLAVHAHVLFAMKRVYARPWWSTILRFLVLAPTYYLFLGLGLAFAVFLGVLSS